MNFETIKYSSSVDGTGDLLTDVCFKPDAKAKPIVLLMHGYNCTRQHMTQDIQTFAERDMFAIAPDMRGSGDSAGVRDSGGLDVHDVIDAAIVATRKYGEQIDTSNINIVGYSGGGGIAISAGCRFPDLFNTAVSFFGISDYAAWYRSKGRADCNLTMDKLLGPPDQEQAKYDARNMIQAAGNALKTNWWLFWDELETQCPPEMIDDWIDACKSAGGRAVNRKVSLKDDKFRWLHGHRSGVADLSEADSLFLPDIISQGSNPHQRLKLPETGELVVPGYLITRNFSVFVSDGKEGSVRIRYDLTPSRPKIDVIENKFSLPVKISTNSVTAPFFG